ncbi:colorectal cancer associated 2 [Dunckerocampus dactyliophorus]|uniref:colorectal cancer associated 2 n=1 Tax=Dunckerocampus dactyliophorus TaxID=161453 RepID=UPI0024049270|nr:colorectal cancer associated 2 [Dunckerocampus dactyliophorus]
MSDKGRVYQGVRVKTTVKELLQRHRAREANRKKVKTISQACLELQALCASTLPNVALEAPPVNPPVDPGPRSAAAHLLRPASDIQERQSSFWCNQQPFGDTTNNYNNTYNNNYYYNTDTCLPALPPWSLPAENDDFVMALCSSPESLKLCSPADSFSSSPSSSCYDSPPRMESSFSGFTSEDCSCLPPQESFCAPQCSSYYTQYTDFYSFPTEENCYKMSTDMCYNVL